MIKVTQIEPKTFLKALLNQNGYYSPCCTSILSWNLPHIVKLLFLFWWPLFVAWGLVEFCSYKSLYSRNPSSGLATKAKGLQGCKPKRGPRVTSHTPGSVRKCEGVNPHTPKATLTLGDGVPVDSQNFREQFQGSKLNGLWHSLYHWKALGT